MHCVQKSSAPIVGALTLIGLAACGGTTDEMSEFRYQDINPADFVLLPCGALRPQTPCALAVAGGKHILIGTPAGVGHAFPADEVRILDVVILPSMRAADIEGLDEIRNRSWREGRGTILNVAGPQGTETVVRAVNTAFEQADALQIVENEMPPGGFNAALLIGEAFEAGELMFDTGDVQLRLTEQGLEMSYSGALRVAFLDCRLEREEPDPEAESEPEVEVTEDGIRQIGCGNSTDLNWPLEEPVYLVKTEE